MAPRRPRPREAPVGRQSVTSPYTLALAQKQELQGNAKRSFEDEDAQRGTRAIASGPDSRNASEAMTWSAPSSTRIALPRPNIVQLYNTAAALSPGSPVHRPTSPSTG
ncbi:hypothetical protein ACCO45_008786 [Purpureocillium lilacinum]|uniref:Uncharacterized protein n=1 Tax=Purpureocillium lilacinum TaxID=33203 RepID=A0ACC4DKS5_PURLI